MAFTLTLKYESINIECIEPIRSSATVGHILYLCRQMSAVVCLLLQEHPFSTEYRAADTWSLT